MTMARALEKTPLNRKAKSVDEEHRRNVAREILAGMDGYDDLNAADKSAAVDDLIAYEDRGPRLLVKIDNDGGKLMIGSHSSESSMFTDLRLTKIFGTSSPAFANRQVLKMFRYFRDSKENPEGEVNAALSFIEGMEARNETEAALLTQMAMANHAATETLGRMERVDFIDQSIALGNLANKFMRTFVAQTEALAKLRRNGVQEVRHIHIDNRGGQAVVAEHIHQGGKDGHHLHNAVCCAPLLSEDAQGCGVSLTGLEREGALSAAWRDVSGCPDGQPKGAETRGLYGRNDQRE